MIHKVITHLSNIKMYHIIYLERKTCKKDPLHPCKKNNIFLIIIFVKSQFFFYTQMCVYMWILPLSVRTCMYHESLSFYLQFFIFFWGSSIHAYVSKQNLNKYNTFILKKKNSEYVGKVRQKRRWCPCHENHIYKHII